MEVFALVVAFLAIVLVVLGAKRVPQGEEYTVERFGRYTKTLRPGLNLIVPVVDTVGAGDAFASVCILGLQRDWPHALILDRAQQFAAVLVGTRGATLNDPKPYNALLAEWQ